MSAQALIIRRFSFIALSAGAASCISLIGGMGLEAVQEKLLPLVPLLIALPALNTMVGDYAAIIAAHAGDPAENKASKKVLAHAIAKAIWVNVVGVLALSIAIAWQRGYIFSSEFILKFIVFAVFSMVSVIAVMFLITSALDKALESRNLNADDVLIPIVTSITDVFMLLLVAAAAWTIF